MIVPRWCCCPHREETEVVQHIPTGKTWTDYEEQLMTRAKSNPKLIHTFIGHKKKGRPTISPLKKNGGNLTSNCTNMATHEPSHLSQYTPHTLCSTLSLVMPLTPEVLTYLQDDGTLVLPEGSQPEMTYERGPMPEEPAQDWDHCETSGSVVEGPKLEDFTNKIRDAIAKLGGSVFPKLNWSAPKDASWIAFNNSLRCSTPGDVFLLLKSSSFVTHDLTAPFKDCDDSSEGDSHVDYCLVLRKWMDINPAYEFRCFVRDKELVDVFDVYRPAKDRVLLLDFNPFGETTDSLLFSWSEMRQSEDEGQGLSRARISCFGNLLAFLTQSGANMHCKRIIEDEISDMRIEDTEDSNMLHYNERNLTDSNRQTPPRDALPEFRFISDATGVQPSPYM
ncbi:Cell division cycle protein 123 [Portunus trituberculatus]|uniref:Cell division cycle protein 123 n=1 Tax=Portunus trituberculatus TaxID=210409 RepID=A0A5B7CSC9_PORTR|nr:Cell division cycle protein 123 [Portunus trituberculatus]